MRILMALDLHHPFLLGGGETRMYEIACGLAKKHEIHVLTRGFRRLPSNGAHKSELFKLKSLRIGWIK